MEKQIISNRCGSKVYRTIVGMGCMLLMPIMGYSQNWQRIEALPDVPVKRVLVDADTIYAAADTVVYVSLDAGKQWTAGTRPVAGTDPIDMSDMLLDGQRLYVSVIGEGVFVSADKGQSWEPFNSGLTGWARNIYSLVSWQGSLIAGTDGGGIYRTALESGPAWQSFSKGLHWSEAMVVRRIGETLITSNNGYIYTLNAGTDTWTARPLTDQDIQRWIYDFIELDGDVFAGTTRGQVYRASKSDWKWQLEGIRQFTDEGTVTRFYIFENRLFANLDLHGSESFICSTTDQGEPWSVHSHEYARLLDMAIRNHTLYAGQDNGLWTMDIGGWTHNAPLPSVPRHFELYPNFPNPFNPSTRIRFMLPTTDRVLLKVYNAYGQEVVTLLDGVRSAGLHEIDFQPANLATGIYLYELTAGNQKYTRKMIYLK